MPSARRFLASVRVRTTLTAAAVVAVALTLAAVALVAILQHAMVDAVDSEIGLRAADLTAASARGGLPERLAGGIDDNTVAQAVDGRGRVVAQSAGIRGSASIVPAADLTPGRVRTVHDPPMGDGSDYRVLVQRVTGRGQPTFVLVGGSLEPTRDAVNTVLAILAVGIPALVLLVSVLVWWLVGRTLGVVEVIRREVAAISDRALDRRIPEPRTADEIQRLARTMNDMLARLDTSRRHEQRFVADAAHELRAPLTNLRTQLDVALAHPDATDGAALHASVHAQVVRISELVEDLLLLARADEHGLGRSLTLVDLDEIVFAQAGPVLDRGRVRIDLSGVNGARVRGDPRELERVVVNLLDNAERHAGTTVRVEVGRENGLTRLVVDDDGAGIPPADRVRVFERFTRLEDGRGRRGGGTGLGLAIVSEVVRAYHGSVEIADPDDWDHGTRVLVSFPSAAE